MKTQELSVKEKLIVGGLLVVQVALFLTVAHFYRYRGQERGMPQGYRTVTNPLGWAWVTGDGRMALYLSDSKELAVTDAWKDYQHQKKGE